ncbi:SCP-2 sterol transfer family protein [Tahibacter aquaticus]|uniref:SCP-2 sterol transfer family protein n=1 Tax=Tahibacter aquaticus TaxID=520092 RepID=A0A4R6Z0N3_9GAMM|nr:sulfotransferase [Tahibacter aquaticus]TDR45083.1 SCP-2 sterol transfer family protein [Tahibacter aquaticus]
MNAINNNAPIFVVCCSRSGSTLLRYVLDSHAEVGCPPELHLGELCKTLSWTHALIHQSEKNSELTRQRCREVIDGMMSDYQSRVGKARWCDKSISTVDHLALVRSVFPDARFVCLYRNCMDVVHSGMEVSRFGYSGYGFSSFVSKRPDNVVAAIMDYWCDKTAKALAFEERESGSVHRVQYEDLVFYPDQVVPALLQFLGMSPDPGLVERIFAISHQGGPGDSNIVFTRRIEQGGVGKGKAIPLRQIPAEQLQRANVLLARLGYAPIGPDWDSAPSPYLPAVPLAGGSAAVQDDMDPGQMLTLLCGLIGKSSQDGAIRFVFDDRADEVWRIVLENGAAAVVRGDAAADCEVRLPLPLLVAIGQGQANPMKLLNAGKIHISGNGDLARRMFQV